MAITRQNPKNKVVQPPIQADGVQQIHNFNEQYDANGVLCASTDPWGNGFQAGELVRVRTVNTNTTLVGAESDATPDTVVIVNTASLTMTLPDPVPANVGQLFTIKVIPSTTTTIRAVTNANTVEGANTISLSAAANKYVTLVQYGTGYAVIANN